MTAGPRRPSSVAHGPIHRVEHHDGAYVVWRDAGVRDRVLVHIDAHHDLYGCWSDYKQKINIANYVYAALEQGFVRAVIWVVPDQTWHTQRGRRDIVRAIQRIDQGTPKKKPTVRVEADRITSAALGKPLQVCTLQNLSVPDEDVLLDIDVDYFTIPNIGYRNIDVYGALPWCWPDELLAKLQARRVHTDLATIAYSVEGGYTPLQWKYLGDELAQRLTPTSSDLDWATEMRCAADAAARHEFARAESHYLAARGHQPEAAAPCYHLAHLCAALGRVQEGRDYYRWALDRDPSFRTAYNSQGFWYYWSRRREQARTAFERTLLLDSDDAYAHLGLGLLALRAKEWSRAEESLKRALDLNEDCVDAYRGMGRLLAHRRDNTAAIQAYEFSLKLTLSGQRALSDDSALGIGLDRTWSDPHHADIHAELARLYEANREYKTAITGYRMAIIFGANSAANWAALALLYWRMRRWRPCANALGQAIKVVPRDAAQSLMRSWRRLRRLARDSWRKARFRTRLSNGKPSLWV